MIKTVARNADCALVRFLNYIVNSAMSTSTEVTLNLILVCICQLDDNKNKHILCNSFID